MPDGCVVIDEGTIAYAGPSKQAPPTPDAERFEVPVVMPGLWECHGHFVGIKGASLEEMMMVPTQVSAGRVVKDAEAVLAAGFTSVREAGGLGVFLARLVDEGTVPGPSIYAAGAVLSQTGGHGDIHAFPIPWVVEFGDQGGAFHLCDGVPGCLKAVRTQLRLGAKVIKICASGGVMSEVDHPVHQQFSDDELRAIVEEAARAERVVMAHCHGKPGIMAALEADCKTIEHGTYLDEEAADLMRDKDAILVPTRLIVERLLATGKEAGMPDYAYQKLAAISDRHKEAITIAHQAGVKIALGTDIATSGAETAIPWGTNGHELRHLVEAGLTPLEAIEAATANGPPTLGPQAPRSGLLAAGHDADLIAVAANPLDDISTLTDPRNVTMVWKAGQLVKGAR
ncbi:MAG: amidohydrolase family protein [Acidimicrobiia bacterium]